MKIFKKIIKIFSKKSLENYKIFSKNFKNKFSFFGKKSFRLAFFFNRTIFEKKGIFKILFSQQINRETCKIVQKFLCKKVIIF